MGKCTFPCWVIFEDNLKRNDELAVTVLDYSRVNPNMELLSTKSLTQPIGVRNIVYKNETDLRITSMSNFKAFCDIFPVLDEPGMRFAMVKAIRLLQAVRHCVLGACSYLLCAASS